MSHCEAIDVRVYTALSSASRPADPGRHGRRRHRRTRRAPPTSPSPTALVVAVGRVDGSAATRVIDADGALVTPGFVDIHTHYDGQATWDDRLVPSSWHGVTTVVMGNCGVGFAPCRPERPRPAHRADGGRRGHPRHRAARGPPVDVGDASPSTSTTSAGRPFDVDVAAQVPHGAVRLYVMGERGAQRRARDRRRHRGDGPHRRARRSPPARSASPRRARTNHRTSRGEPTPDPHAPPSDELVGIATRASASAGGVLEVVSDFRDLDVEFATHARAWSRRRAARCRSRSRPRTTARRGRAARPHRRRRRRRPADQGPGRRPRHRRAARPAGDGQPVLGRAGVPRDRRLAARRAGARAATTRAARAILAELAEHGARPHRRASTGCSSSATRPTTSPPRRRASRRAPARRGVEPAELASTCCSPTTARRSSTSRCSTGSTARSTRVGEMLADAHLLPGLADGGAHVGTICDASFPTTLLAHWARDRDARACRSSGSCARQCRATAETVGLLDRGLLAPGLQGRRHRRRPRPPPPAPARHGVRPARGGQAPAAAGRRLPAHLRGRRRDLRRGRTDRRPPGAIGPRSPPRVTADHVRVLHRPLPHGRLDRLDHPVG